MVQDPDLETSAEKITHLPLSSSILSHVRNDRVLNRIYLTRASDNSLREALEHPKVPDRRGWGTTHVYLRISTTFANSVCASNVDAKHFVGGHSEKS